MARNGVVVSQQGVPVDRAADYQKVLDSNRKSLNILEELEIDVFTSAFSTPNGYKKTKLYDHNLGWPAAFEFVPSQLSGGNPDVIFNGLSDIVTSLASDDSAIYYVPLYTGGSTNPVRVKGRLRVFMINPLEEYAAPLDPVASMEPTDLPKYGAKFLDPNRGRVRIDDANVFPFSLNTRAKQISVHKSGTQAAVSGLLTITHNVGYPPTYMVGRVQDDSWWGSFFGNPFGVGVKSTSAMSSTAISAKATASTITFKGQQTSVVGTFHYLILKDPSEIVG